MRAFLSPALLLITWTLLSLGCHAFDQRPWSECGNGACEIGEACETCPTDCGTCFENDLLLTTTDDSPTCVKGPNVGITCATDKDCGGYCTANRAKTCQSNNDCEGITNFCGIVTDSCFDSSSTTVEPSDSPTVAAASTEEPTVSPSPENDSTNSPTFENDSTNSPSENDSTNSPTPSPSTNSPTRPTICTSGQKIGSDCTSDADCGGRCVTGWQPCFTNADCASGVCGSIPGSCSASFTPSPTTVSPSPTLEPSSESLSTTEPTSTMLSDEPTTNTASPSVEPTSLERRLYNQKSLRAGM